MVLTDRRRRVGPARAVRRSIPPLLTRSLTLSGLIAAGWLLAGVGTAFADDAFPKETRVRASVEAEESQRPLTGTADLVQVGGVLDEVARSAESLVVDTVSAVAAAEKAGDRSRAAIVGEDGVLDGTLPTGLARSTEEVVGELREAVVAAPVRGGPSTPDLNAASPAAGTTEYPPPVAPRAQRDSGDGAECGECVDSANPGAGTPAGAVSADQTAASGSRNADSADPSADPGVPSGGPWRPEADPAGTVASSSAPAPAAAGYLTSRTETVRPAASYAVLQGDPTLVVRDAADDPSFSPD